MMKRKKLFLLLVTTCVACVLTGQDIHFSQYYASPLLLNPAKTGFFDASYRATAVYRNQWSSVTIPYKTIAASVDGGVIVGNEGKSILGFGGVLFSDKAGDANYSTTSFNASVSYNLAIGKKLTNYLSFGLMGGLAKSNYDFNALYFDEDYLLGQNTEAMGSTGVSYGDFSLGVEYNYLRTTTNYQIGIAMFHLNDPALTYYKNSDSKIFRKTVINIGMTKKLSQALEIYPRAAIFIQGPYHEIDLGGFARFNIDKNYQNRYALYGGLTYRVMDALIPNIRLEYNSLNISLSYDVNISKLTQASHVRGGPEIALLYTGKIKGYKPRKIFCPRF